MASALCHSTLLIFLLVAELCSARTGYDSSHDLEMGIRHELWMAEHGRVYEDEAERALRFEIFRRNVKYIEDFNNAGEHNYTLGVNLFADLTNEEYRDTYASGLKIPADGEFEESLSRSFKYETMEEEGPSYTKIPDSFDWRDEGAVTSVKFQMNCSCCWAFAAAATIEGLHKIKKGVLVDLSVQQILDCTEGGNDCRGGYVDRAYAYIIKNGGVSTWANYPYVDTRKKCDRTKSKEIVASIKRSGRLLSSEGVHRAAVARQPIAAGVDASGHDFQFYKEGIFSGICGSTVNHAVVMVGYGEEGGEKYWIIKNSYSSRWGEAGYIRMKRDDVTRVGVCAILSDSYYPAMS